MTPRMILMRAMARLMPILVERYAHAGAINIETWPADVGYGFIVHLQLSDHTLELETIGTAVRELVEQATGVKSTRTDLTKHSGAHAIQIISHIQPQAFGD